MAQPSGMESPFLSARMILPRATTLVAMSIITGSPWVGAPTARGFVPRYFSRLPQGAIDLGALELTMASIFSLAAIRI